MSSKPIRTSQSHTNKSKDEQDQGRTDSGTNTIIAPIEWYNGFRYYQLKKNYSYDRCTNPVYFDTPLLII